MTWNVLVSAPYAMPIINEYRERLEAAGCSVRVADVRERLDEKELLELVEDLDGIICGDDHITDRVLDAAPRLKVISKWGTGIDSIDVEAAERRGVAVRNTPNAFSEPVADTVLGYMLLFARQLDTMDATMKAGRWRKAQLVSLGECTLGVIGVGNCGKAVVRRAAAFGMELLGNDPVEMPAAFLEETGIRMVDLDTLLRESDFISLNPDLNPTSRHLLSHHQIAAMKPSAYVINVSRGPVIDEAALIRGLEDGEIAGAALDVFENEPLPEDSPLRGMQNVRLAPHNANSSPRAARHVHENTIANLLDGLTS